MAGKGKRTPGRREVFGSKQPPTPLNPPQTLPVEPVELESTVESQVGPVDASEDVNQPEATPEHDKPTNEPAAAIGYEPEPVRGAGGGLATASPFAAAAVLVDPSPRPETPKPCRRGHVQAKVIAVGSLNVTGYTLDGEQRSTWSKGEMGEFPRASVDGIYLEAL